MREETEFRPKPLVNVGGNWPAASFIDVWAGLRPYLRNTSMYKCQSDQKLAWNHRWTQYWFSKADSPFEKQLPFPCSYYYFASFYKNVVGGNMSSGLPGQSMPVSAVRYPTKKAIYDCYAGQKASIQWGEHGMLLCFVDWHVKLVSLADLNKPNDYNLDYTYDGIRGKDIKD